jgi:hypothetical protein
VADLQPVEFTIARDHQFRAKPRHEDGRKRIGCRDCGFGKLARQHLGAPPSLNEGGSGMNRMAYQALKRAWTNAIFWELQRAVRTMPTIEWQSCTAEVQIGFDQYRERDEGNMRWMIEKALGDVLVDCRFLPDDSFWPTRRYSMGNLEGRHTPGESWTRFLLFPSVTVPTPWPRSGQESLSAP